MPKRRSKIAKPPKPLEETQVNEWNFTKLLNTDIKEIDVGVSLGQLGNIRVMEWDFKDVIPVVKKTANIEIDLIGGNKRVANYKTAAIRNVLKAVGRKSGCGRLAPNSFA